MQHVVRSVLPSFDGRGRDRRGPRLSAMFVAIALLLTSVVVGVPTAQAQALCTLGVVCEAELGDLHNGAGTHNEHPGYTGSGFVDQLFGAAGVVLTVDADEAGPHQVTIRYANGDPGFGLASRQFTLTVNGATDIPVHFPVTGTWTTWSTVTVPVTLTAGTNELDIHTGAGNNGPINIDHIVVTSADTTVEQGATLRIFDVDIALQELCTLKPGQTPNVDVLRPVIDWSTTQDWEGYTSNFVAQVVADIETPVAGDYTFRLTSDDGSRLSINGEQVIDNDGVHGDVSVDGTVELDAGVHALEIDYFQAGGGATLKLEWQVPGSSAFTVVPNAALTTEGGGARVVAPGIKECEGVGDGSGDGLPLSGVHPSFDLVDLRPDDSFQPDVSGMAWYPDGSLAVLTWGKSQLSSSGKLYRVENVQGAVDLDDVEVTEIASGLQEPQGVAIVGDEVWVSSKSGLDLMVDADGDGYFEDYDRLVAWPHVNNFHEFAFGLPYRDGYFYVAVSSALTRAGDTSLPQPSPDRGLLAKVEKDTGEVEFIAGGLRTPNGIEFGPNGKLLITDNQGGWLPVSKLIEIEEGAFFNQFTSYIDPVSGETIPGMFDEQPVTPPVVWMPQNEIANSPSTPVVMEEGLFAGQLAIGDVTYGGVQRVFMEEVEGQQQGALYRMTQGLEAGINEVSVGPDGDIYLGGIGYDGNWNQPGKLRYGLQKLTANDTVTMDILRTEITESGFDITYTKPLSPATRQNIANAYEAQQWTYGPTSAYGGPKMGVETLDVVDATVSEDGTVVSLEIPGIEPGHVVHVRSPRPFRADDGEELWSTEVWYTANVVPGYVGPPAPFYEAEHEVPIGESRIASSQGNYSGDGYVTSLNQPGAGVRFEVEVAEAGEYDLGIRYANGSPASQGSKSMSLVIDGEPLRQVLMPSTLTWNRWGMVRERVTLEAGMNLVSVLVDAGDTGDVFLDAMSVRPAGERINLIGEDGDLSEWQHTDGRSPQWQLQDDGSVAVNGGDLRTKEAFEDYRLHVEFWLPEYPPHVTGQNRANSGVYNQERYEIQVLDSYGVTNLQSDDAAGIYQVKAADVNAATPPETWQTYDILYTSARYEEGQKVADARITVEWNGQLVHDDVEIPFATTAGAPEGPATGPLMLQDHGSPVRYRNVWIEPIYNALPELTASATPVSGDVPLEVDFTASAIDPEGTEVSIVWDFGDGSPTVDAAHVRHTYTEPGAYRAQVTATDEDGRASVRSFNILATVDCDQAPAGRDDNFDGNVLDRCRWTHIVRENPAGYRVADGRLEIDAAPGDMFGANAAAANLILQDAPGGAWEAVTKVTLPQGPASYEQAGLMLHHSDQNYAKLNIIDVPGQGWQGEFSYTSNGSAVFNEGLDRSQTLPAGINTDGIWLRMTSDGAVLTGAWSADGEAWTTFGRDIPLAGMPSPRIGLAAFNGNGQTATFDFFSITGEEVDPPVELDLDVDAGVRCVAGNVFVTVTARNNHAAPVDVEIISDYGTRTFAAVASDRFASHAYNTRSSTLDGGSVTVRSSARIDGIEVSDEQTAEIDAASC